MRILGLILLCCFMPKAAFAVQKGEMLYDEGHHGCTMKLTATTVKDSNYFLYVTNKKEGGVDHTGFLLKDLEFGIWVKEPHFSRITATYIDPLKRDGRKITVPLVQSPSYSDRYVFDPYLSRSLATEQYVGSIVIRVEGGENDAHEAIAFYELNHEYIKKYFQQEKCQKIPRYWDFWQVDKINENWEIVETMNDCMLHIINNEEEEIFVYSLSADVKHLILEASFDPFTAFKIDGSYDPEMVLKARSIFGVYLSYVSQDSPLLRDSDEVKFLVKEDYGFKQHWTTFQWVGFSEALRVYLEKDKCFRKATEN